MATSVTAAPETLDAFGRLLDQVAGYYDAFPVVWWTIVGLAAWWIAWRNVGRRRGGP